MMPNRKTNIRRTKPKANGRPPTMPPTVPTMPFVSFINEAHLDPNGLLAIDHMEEDPFADVAPMDGGSMRIQRTRSHSGTTLLAKTTR